MEEDKPLKSVITSRAKRWTAGLTLAAAVAVAAAPGLTIAAPSYKAHAALKNARGGADADVAGLCEGISPGGGTHGNASFVADQNRPGAVQVKAKFQAAQPGEWYAARLIDQRDCSSSGELIYAMANQAGKGKIRFQTPVITGESREYALLLYDLDVANGNTAHILAGGARLDMPGESQRDDVMEAAKAVATQSVRALTGLKS
jgi:hypothetical protein